MHRDSLDAVRATTSARYHWLPDARRGFERLPRWMWRNHEVLAFVEWLRDWNATHAPLGFSGR